MCRIQQTVDHWQEGERTVLSLSKFVHCHICPLKEFCSSGEPDASWRIQHQGQTLKRKDVMFTVAPEVGDFARIQKATSNCPLRMAVSYSQTALTKEFLGKKK